MPTIESEIAPFFPAWYDYQNNLKDAYVNYTQKYPPNSLTPHKDRVIPSEVTAKKFACLADVDKCFHGVIKLMIEGLFKRNPLIHEGRGNQKEVELYQQHISAWWPDPKYGKKELLPPRVNIFRYLESERDVWEVLIKLYSIDETGLTRLFKISPHDRHLVRFSHLTRDPRRSEEEFARVKALYEKVKYEEENFSIIEPDKFWAEFNRQWSSVRNAILALAENDKRAKQVAVQMGKIDKTPAPQAEQEAAPWWKKVKRYFGKNHKWLVPAIIGFIGMIVGIIEAFL